MDWFSDYTEIKLGLIVHLDLNKAPSNSCMTKPLKEFQSI